MPDDYQTSPIPRVRPEGGRHRRPDKPRRRPPSAVVRGVLGGSVFAAAAAFVIAVAANIVPTVGVQQLAEPDPSICCEPTLTPPPTPSFDLSAPEPTPTAVPTPAALAAPVPTTTTQAPVAKPKPAETTKKAKPKPKADETSTTDEQPAGNPTARSAAAKFGWGPVVAGDEFNSGSKPGSNWSMYDGEGHDGEGRRTPNAFTVHGGMLRVHGDSKGNTGGMAYKDGQFRGRWEARMRVPKGDSQYHPVLILWPDREDFPEGGEIDYAETSASSDEVDFFLHYGKDNSQTHGSAKVDLTQWHNYAVEWTSKCITGYVDAVQFFQDCNTSHLPPRPMHMTIQLDYFPKGGSPSPTDMYVDYVRQYKL